MFSPSSLYSSATVIFATAVGNFFIAAPESSYFLAAVAAGTATVATIKVRNESNVPSVLKTAKKMQWRGSELDKDALKVLSDSVQSVEHLNRQLKKAELVDGTFNLAADEALTYLMAMTEKATLDKRAYRLAKDEYTSEQKSFAKSYLTGLLSGNTKTDRSHVKETSVKMNQAERAHMDTLRSMREMLTRLESLSSEVSKVSPAAKEDEHLKAAEETVTLLRKSFETLDRQSQLN